MEIEFHGFLYRRAQRSEDAKCQIRGPTHCGGVPTVSGQVQFFRRRRPQQGGIALTGVGFGHSVTALAGAPGASPIFEVTH
jgi:hypothetical protein